jgi:hypothetical protein
MRETHAKAIPGMLCRGCFLLNKSEADSSRTLIVAVPSFYVLARAIP